MQRRIRTLSFLLVVVFASISATTARADEVTDWNQILFHAALVAQTSPLFMSRNAAIFQSSVFDAVNGIERRYTPIHVEPGAPHGASARAAAVQAFCRRLTFNGGVAHGTSSVRQPSRSRLKRPAASIIMV
jgi:hypothetical protein